MKTRIIGAIVAVILAAIGTVVLVGYVGAADVRAAQGAKLVDAYIIKSTVPAQTAGEQISGFLEVDKIPASTAVEGRVTDLSTLEGLVASVQLEQGEQLLASRFVDPAAFAAAGAVDLPEGTQAVSLALEVERVVGGALQPGDTVGVVVSAELPYRDPATTHQILHKVVVVDVQYGSTLSPQEGEADAAAAVDIVMVTLAIRTPELERVIWGKEFGGVWLTLEPENADTSGGSNVTDEQVFP